MMYKKDKCSKYFDIRDTLLPCTDSASEFTRWRQYAPPTDPAIIQFTVPSSVCSPNRISISSTVFAGSLDC